MEKTVSVMLLANAGVLIRYEGYTILLDALQESKNTPFSPLPTPLKQKIFCGEDPFSKVDALLFTHLHPDHFSADMTLQYLNEHPDSFIMMPDNTAVPGAEAVIAQAGAHIVLLNDPHPVRYALSPGISVLAIPTRHLDRLYYAVPHYCYLLSFGAKNILFTADIDYTHETLYVLDDVSLDAVFVNPLFLSALHSHHFFSGSLNTKLFCVYHIPFPEDDKTNFRAYTQSITAHWDASSRIAVLDQAQQQLRI